MVLKEKLELEVILNINNSGKIYFKQISNKESAEKN